MLTCGLAQDMQQQRDRRCIPAFWSRRYVAFCACAPCLFTCVLYARTGMVCLMMFQLSLFDDVSTFLVWWCFKFPCLMMFQLSCDTHVESILSHNSHMHIHCLSDVRQAPTGPVLMLLSVYIARQAWKKRFKVHFDLIFSRFWSYLCVLCCVCF